MRSRLMMAAICCFGTAFAETSIQVEPPVRVSPEGSGGHFFGFGNTKSDASDALRLATCGMSQNPATNAWHGYLYNSHDGGRRWSVGLIDSSLAQDGWPGQVSEVSCAIGLGGATYLVAETWNPLYLRPTHGRGVFRLYHSKDGGRTWSKPITGGWHDHSRSVVDNTQGPYRGRLYIFGNAPEMEAGSGIDLRTVTEDSIKLRRARYAVKPLLVSDDHGASLHDPIFPPKDERYATGFPSEAIVLADGTVMAVYGSRYKVPEPANATLEMLARQAFNERDPLVEIVASRDGGRTLQRPVTVRHSKRIVGYQSAIAVTPDSATQAPRRIYVSWVEKQTDAPASRTLIMVASSDDGGRKWSAPTIASDEGAGRSDASSPAIAVNPAGVVGLAWAEDGERCHRFAASTDGGKTFVASVPLHACASQAGLGKNHFRTHLLGTPWPSPSDSNPGERPKRGTGFAVRVDDWSGDGGIAASADGTFHPTWSMANSDGGLWAARVTVASSSRPQVTTAGLVRLSSRVEFAVSGMDYDDATGQVTADVSVINNDEVPVRGPIVLALTSLFSEFGSPTLVNSDGGDHGAGALVEFALDRPTLEPGARTRPRRLVFAIDGIARITDTSSMLASPTLISVTADTYAAADR